MAPLMAGMVVVAAIFFAFVMLARFGSIENTLRDPPQSQVAIPWTRPGLAPTDWRAQEELANNQADFALEREIIARRYRQASAMLSLRLWTRLMGFLTGMILAMVGAAFVLGRLSAPVSEISGGAQGATLSVKSASPGIVLAVLGTVLIAISLLMPVTTDVRDVAVYFGRSGAAAPDTAAPSMDALDPAADADAPPRHAVKDKK